MTSGSPPEDQRQTEDAGNLRIAIGAVACDPDRPGGLNRYTTELLSTLLELERDAIAFVASPALQERIDRKLEMVRIPALARSDFVGNLLRFLWHQTILPAELKRRGVRLFYSPGPDGMLSPPCRQVITVHDLLPLRYPRSAPRLYHYYRHILPRIVHASSAVITVSEASREDLAEFYGMEKERIHVVYQGYRREVFKPASPAEVKAIREMFGLGEYVLAVGETRPYKNIPRLLEAFATLNRPATQLVIVGKLNRRGLDPRALARSLGVADRVIFLEDVSDSRLCALYSGAQAFAFPSLFEGFGIPPLEAMACGCPVVVSRTSSLPEVCGQAALYVDPLDTAELAGALERLLVDPDLRMELKNRGLERASNFSYDLAAKEVRAVLSSCAG